MPPSHARERIAEARHALESRRYVRLYMLARRVHSCAPPYMREHSGDGPSAVLRGLTHVTSAEDRPGRTPRAPEG
jgi:hypothetical protein